MAPVILQLLSDPRFETKICTTGQHREMPDNILSFFGIRPDFNLDIMRHGPDLGKLSAAILDGLSGLFQIYRPDIVLVHGDTVTSVNGALASFYAGIPVGHVEAGLRTGNIMSPWPEEANRRIITSLTRFHFAPTETARENLVREQIASRDICVTGNTVIDALFVTRDRLEKDNVLMRSFDEKFSFLDPDKKIILVTCHRRENLGNGLVQICQAIASVAKNDDVQIIFPVHPNPQVGKIVQRHLAGLNNIFLTGPLDYLPFVHLMQKSCFIMTDSGGIQEEAPALGKPVLVMRDTTERPEAVRAGTVRLIGTDSDNIASAARLLLDNRQIYREMSMAHNPYGDGHASQRIVEHLARREHLRPNSRASSVAPQHILG